MKYRVKQTISLIILALFLAGCSTDIAGEKTPQPIATPAAPAQVADPAAQPGSEHAARDLAVADLKEWLGDDVEITVQEVTGADFSDASLGVPEPGQMYAQVLTPGYVIHLAVGEQVYIYHSDGKRAVLAAQQSHQTIAVPGETAYARVEIAELELSFDAPAGWLRLEPEWLWTPVEGSKLYLGLNWADLSPSQEPEAVLLPGPARILDSQEITLMWGSGRRVWLEVYAPVASVEIHALIVTQDNGLRRALDFYVKGATLDDVNALQTILDQALYTAMLAGGGPQAPSTTDLALSGEDALTGWPVLQDQTYGYQIALPTDWTWKELSMQGPGMPDDWPTARAVLLFPQAWEADLNRSGPPDPNAKMVVAPLQVEVVIGDAAQFRRVYPEPAQSETVEINGLTVIVEKETFGEMTMTRYVFASPENPELRVVVSDQMSGFSERVEGNEAIAALLPQIISSLTLAAPSN